MAGFLSLHNLWPKRWVGYDRVVAGLFGFPASIWDTRITKPALLLLPVQDGSTAPLPARTKTHNKQKAKLSQQKNDGIYLTFAGDRGKFRKLGNVGKSTSKILTTFSFMPKRVDSNLQNNSSEVLNQNARVGANS